MKELLIIGARGFGREVYDLAKQCSLYNIEFVVKGFLDDKSNALDHFTGYPSIVSAVESYDVKEGDVFVCALGEVLYKKKYTEIILKKGGVFMNLIHPTVSINSNVKLGKGLIILNNVFISNDCLVGDFVTIQPNSAIGHDVVLSNWCHINAYSFFGGYAFIEEEVTIHTRASIMPKIKVCYGATVGASSLVIKNVKPNTTVFGMPAKVLKF
jgi:sugar O-acyltransferase (sialic acid O-acetyltransferase NeuD family)